MRLLMSCAVCLVVVGTAHAQQTQPPANDPLNNSLQDWQSVVVIGSNPPATSVQLCPEPACQYTPDNGVVNGQGLLSVGLGQPGPMRVDVNSWSGSLGAAFKTGWQFTTQYAIPIAMTILALTVGGYMVKTYVVRWGG